MIYTDFLLSKMYLTPLNEEQNICVVGPVSLPVKQEDLETTFNWYNWLAVDNQLTKEEILVGLNKKNLAFKQQSSVLVYGDFKNANNVVVRFHSICHTGDIFGSQRCDCGYQLHESMKMVVEHGAGAIFYIANHEGRGIGLFSKSLAYLLQQEGIDTVEANELLGFEDDSRSYDEAIAVLNLLRQKPVTLITNNPNKLKALEEKGLLAEGHIPLWGGLNETNKFYLQTKIKKSGHLKG